MSLVNSHEHEERRVAAGFDFCKVFQAWGCSLSDEGLARY